MQKHFHPQFLAEDLFLVSRNAPKIARLVAEE
jgi:hypothetical protein